MKLEFQAAPGIFSSPAFRLFNLTKKTKIKKKSNINIFHKLIKYPLLSKIMKDKKV